MPADLLTYVNGWWQFLLGLFGAGGAFFTWVRKQDSARKKEQENDLHAKAEVMAMRSLLSVGFNIPINELSIEALRNILSSRSHTLEEVKGFIQTTPAPHVMWMKRRIGPSTYEMVQCNDYFADLYLGQPASSHNNKRDSEIWPEELVRAFAESDENAFVSGKSVHEVLDIYSPLTGTRGVSDVRKWSYTVNQTHYVAALGTFRPSKEKQNG